jgi:hypothetical protein
MNLSVLVWFRLNGKIKTFIINYKYMEKRIYVVIN